MNTHSGILPAEAAPAARPRWLPAAVAAVLALRLVQILIQAGWEMATPTPLRDDVRYYHDIAPDASLFGQLFVKWDGYWYLHIAEWGYSRPAELDGQVATAFAPLYPFAIRVLHGMGIAPALAGVLLSLACFLATLPLLFRLGCLVHSPKMGAALVLWFGLFPSAWVLNMVYTESLFCLLLAGFLVSYLQGRYAVAGICAGLLPFVRVAGVVVVPAILADMVWRRRPVRDAVAAWPAVVGGGCGVVALGAVFAVGTGDAAAFLGAGQGWFARAGAEGHLLPLLHVIPLRLRDDALAPVFVAFLLAYAGLSVWAWVRRRDILSWFGLLYMAMLLQTPILNAQMRYLLPLLPVHLFALSPLLERPRLRFVALAMLLGLQILVTRGYVVWSVII